MSHILETIGTKVIVILTDTINSPLPSRIRFLIVPPLASRLGSDLDLSAT